MAITPRQIQAMIEMAEARVSAVGLGLAPQRRTVLNEAISWIGTPFHDKAVVKGAGVDCLYLIYACYRDAGIIGRVEIPYYRPDFMHHRDEETYWGGILGYGHEVDKPQPADIALFKYGRILGHGAIVVDWPWLIHAYAEAGMVCCSDATQGRLRDRPVKFASAF